MPTEPTKEPAAASCPYCGWLDWTVEKYGRVTHKQACPHRTDPWHQGNPNPSAALAPEFKRPSVEDELRALAWLRDRRDWEEHSPLERRFAATLIDSLAWFEQLEAGMVRIALWSRNETGPGAKDFRDVKEFAEEVLARGR